MDYNDIDDTPPETIPPVTDLAASSSAGRRWLALWIVDGILPHSGRRREKAAKWLAKHVTEAEQADMRAAAARELTRLRARLDLPASNDG